ncbi:MAG TPA: (4Fe-4S)-binding protein [Gemmatimonadaceae bacterium]|jgi:uncharacterized Fe-S cluster protein YjdI|nr:(4Fe-4S)-binding protein [Gemmatimonadaceae bacterium]
MSKRIQLYSTDEISVSFDPSICQHSGVCVRGLPEVFDIKRKHWIRPELATAEEVSALIDKCPSGALKYKLKTDDTPVKISKKAK